MRLFFPESKGQFDFVGYNNLVRLFRKALSEYIDDVPRGTDYRVYCNLPWHHNPRELKAGMPLFVYTMYESTRVPRAWVNFLNRHADAVAVPTEWCKHFFLVSGVKKPIGVLSGGIDPVELPALFKQNVGGEYIFLWQGVAYDPGGRKGVDVAVRAFRELRSDGLLDNARLILKYRPSKDSLAMESTGISGGSGITYLQAELTREELLALYRSVDCCINPTRGEGFGLIPLEQMAMGKPVIVTEFSIPYIEPGCCLPLKYRLERSPVVWNHRFFSVSKNGIAWNIGGLADSVTLAPKLLTLMADGDKVESVPPRPIAPAEALRGRINNLLLKAQRKTGFYFNPRAKARAIYQENPGKDAEVDLQDLKQKMLWCYNNREAAEDMGMKAREYVLREWSLERMKSDFHKNIIPLLERGLHGRRSQNN